MSWGEFYNNIKDESWPDCEFIEDFTNLSKEIQMEILREFLFEKRIDNLKNALQKNSELDIANFLYFLDNVKKIIGPKHCLMNTQDTLFLYTIISSKRPKKILEIGRYHGWSTTLISGAIRDNGTGHLWSVDIHDFLSQDTKLICQEYTTFINQNSNVLLDIPEISQQKFDLIFIDGNHSYKMVLNDLTTSHKLSSDESWFLLHDIDSDQVKRATDDFVYTTPGILDYGTYGQKIQLLHKKRMI